MRRCEHLCFALLSSRHTRRGRSLQKLDMGAGVFHRYSIPPRQQKQEVEVAGCPSFLFSWTLSCADWAGLYNLYNNADQISQLKLPFQRPGVNSNARGLACAVAAWTHHQTLLIPLHNAISLIFTPASLNVYVVSTLPPPHQPAKLDTNPASIIAITNLPRM